MPHELVSQLIKSKYISNAECNLYDAQWSIIRNNVTNNNTLGKMIPIIDVSGSMNGTPKEVAIALGILVSEITHDTFRNRFITFHEKPSWVNLSDCTTLQDKVNKTKNSSWGCSTNFEAVYELILQVAISAKIEQSEMPESLIIFSDMQFNQADPNNTTFELMKTRFNDEGYTLPKIIFWNLRGDTNGFPVTAYDEEVQIISGFSPSLLKLFLNGDPMNKNNPKITPYDTYLKVINDEIYNPVREIINASGEIY
jgi:hypothetical protein